MGDLLNYQSDNHTIVELLEKGIYFSPYLLRNFNIAKGESFPAVVQSYQSKVFMMEWGIDDFSKSITLTHLFLPSMIKQTSLKKLLLHQRILIPVNQLIHNESEIKISAKNGNILFMAGVWQEKQDGKLGFAILTKNNEGKLPIKRLPLLINSKEDISLWLNKETKILNEINYFIQKEIELDIQTNPVLI